MRALGGRSGMNTPSNDDAPPPTLRFRHRRARRPERRHRPAADPSAARWTAAARVGCCRHRAATRASPKSQPSSYTSRPMGILLQKDYGSAEAGFDDFLKRHSGHQLAGNAQYWLGETYYVRGQYRAAAAAFLKGYQTYSRSPKAPECLLKLAMSLQRLGQKDAACSSFNELATKYPNPPAHVRSIAQTERQRSGCDLAAVARWPLRGHKMGTAPLCHGERQRPHPAGRTDGPVRAACRGSGRPVRACGFGRKRQHRADGVARRLAAASGHGQ